MSKRRERAKAQNAKQGMQATATVAKPEERHPIAKKMGDFFIDVAKLVIGGVILAGLMKQDIDYVYLSLCASGAVLFLVGLGLYLINVSDKNK